MVVPVEEAAMSALYPSLEDMKVDQTLQAQANAAARALAGVAEKSEPAAAPPVLYPNLTELGDYMGLSLSSDEVQKDLALVPASGNAGALVPSSQGVLVAPLTGNNLGLRRAEIKPGLRELHLCKDERGKTGLQLKSIDQGVFVQLVKANSPASLVGLRFGDQVLQIDGKDCAGWSTDKANRALKKAAPEKIVVIVRDRPFQRTVTMHKDSTGHVGFVIKKGKIVSLTKGSSAARNGLLINHYICELNGQNVIGLKVKAPGEMGREGARGRLPETGPWPGQGAALARGAWSHSGRIPPLWGSRWKHLESGSGDLQLKICLALEKQELSVLRSCHCGLLMPPGSPLLWKRFLWRSLCCSQTRQSSWVPGSLRGRFLEAPSPFQWD
ncbi:hypothetical protein KIL84_010041 [Mauremys mutica]|uniref:PDZ domain-containing protein n=1 Tax=Mauremys mutica TaxID=74926 RepID=A0A9D3XLS1_9SAUR|nr:hypothetical protein KIL84_010041 [Mauremys mutica]